MGISVRRGQNGHLPSGDWDYELLKRFVNVHLHWNLKKTSKMSMLTPWKICAGIHMYGSSLIHHKEKFYLTMNLCNRSNIKVKTKTSFLPLFEKIDAYAFLRMLQNQWEQIRWEIPRNLKHHIFKTTQDFKLNFTKKLNCAAQHFGKV